jgi:hypothetical protein
MLETSTASLDTWLDLQPVLQADIRDLMDRLYRERTSQTLRRAFVRGAWGYIEGSTHGVGEFVRTLEDLANAPHPHRPAEKIRTMDRLKFTLSWAADRLAPGWEPTFSDSGWKALREGLPVRDRLMHPKKADDLTVSDDEIDRLRDALMWFTATMRDLQQQSLDRAMQHPAVSVSHSR